MKKQNLFVNKKLKILFLVSFFLLGYLIFKIPSFSWIDQGILNFFGKLRCPFATNYFYICTTFGSALLIIALLIILFFIIKNKKCNLILMLSLILVSLSNRILKFLVKRPRPELFFKIEESGYSFPSGHSMASAFFYGFLILLILNSNLSKKVKTAGVIVLSILILSIGMSRIYFQVHYPSDVLAGFSLGFLALLFVWPIYEKEIK